MAEDICRKSAIIETYVMDSRRGELSSCCRSSQDAETLKLMPSSSTSSDVSSSAVGAHGGSQGDRGGLGSVLRDLVKPGDENLREMNKKLQNMLEEQLTKNMHLQKVRHTPAHTSAPFAAFKADLYCLFSCLYSVTKCSLILTKLSKANIC